MFEVEKKFLLDEAEDEMKIREFLRFSMDGSLGDLLKENGYTSFCICTTTRTKYRKGEFTLDFDSVDFQDFQYSLCEIELMVKSKSECSSAIEKITQFALDHGLKITPVRGKVAEYLKRMRPKHYQMLIRNGSIQDV